LHIGAGINESIDIAADDDTAYNKINLVTSMSSGNIKCFTFCRGDWW